MYLAGMEPQRLPFGKLILYGFGIFGWSLSLNIVSTLLSYMYLPPAEENTDLVSLVPQTTYLYVFNIIALVMASGRLIDAMADPIIANLSDRLRHPLGRRIPLMRLAPAFVAVFCTLMFTPPVKGESMENVRWLALVQIGYYVFFAMYVIPYNALLAELGHYPNGKMHLSTAQSVGFMAGVFAASTITKAATLFPDALGDLRQLQYAVGVYNAAGAVCMWLPAFLIDERKYCRPANASEPLLQSLRTALRVRNFRIFAFADAVFFMSIALISSGLLYYITAMLGMSREDGYLYMGIMLFTTLLMYYPVNVLEKKYSKKMLIIFAFGALSVVFFGICFLGRIPLPPWSQAALLMVSFGLFDSFLGILPNTVVADIAHAEAHRSGQNKEGMFFGMRALFQKLGQTMGVMLFMMLTLYGKDPGNDTGLRMSGAAGGVLCALAAAVYVLYREKEDEV
ncbi:MAG: MFS transporter [Chitinophagales bacterium]|nr:MFS transporter [Chitinophagales bacterium]MDW8418447.1 MFS transporter [Chitinophagales bacterium]